MPAMYTKKTMNRAPAKLPSHTTTQALSIWAKVIFLLLSAQTISELPVNSSAPHTSTSTRPRQKHRPPTTRWAPQPSVLSLKNTVKNRPPKAINAPANIANRKAFATGRLALVTPAASVLASIAAGARQSGAGYSTLESAMSITSFLISRDKRSYCSCPKRTKWEKSLAATASYTASTASKTSGDMGL